MTGPRALARRARDRARPVLDEAVALLRAAGRRAPEVVVVVGVVVSVLLALVLVGAARNDAHIDAATGRAVAEVLEGGSRPHVYVRFTTDEGAVLTPEKGVFYPLGLEPGQLVRVEYDRTDPELVRLASWNRLERVPAGDLLEAHPGLADPKHEAIARAQNDGRIIADIPPDEVYALIVAIAGTWSPSSVTYTASPDDDEADHERRRQVLRRIVARALVP